MDGRFVAYYRVSRESQGINGLGMEAQRKAVSDYLNGGDWELLDSYNEVESGKRDDNRPELLKAVQRCKTSGATLVIAKLDRLSRDVHFLTGLQKAGIDFVCCDMPHADRFTVHILAAVAQKERENTSARTKAGLAIIKDKIARGEEHRGKLSGRVVTALGNPNGMSPERAASGRQKRTETANSFAATVAPTAKALKAGGMTLAGIADRLNEMNVTTPRGKGWTPMAVKRVLDRV
jgi:DNA invertase Pin-like site-specific DNA recombinase